MNEAIKIKAGIKLVRVTACLSIINKEGLNRWRGQVGNDYADTKLEIGRARGNRRHELFERIANGEINVEKSITNESDLKIVNGFQHWINNEVDEIITIENRMESKKYGLSGKPDIIVKLKSHKHYAVADYKSGSFLDKKIVAWQLAGYVKLAKEQGIEVRHRCVIHCHDQFKKPEFFPQKNVEADFRNLLYCREIFLAIQ